MGRKTTTTVEDEADTTETPSENGKMDMSEFIHLPGDVQEAISKSEMLLAQNWNVTLYRVSGAGRKGTKRTVLDSMSEIPSEREVGLEYGAGVYLVWISFYSKKKSGSSSLTLKYDLDDPVWNQRKMEVARERDGVGPNDPTVYDPMAAMRQNMEMFTGMLTALSPLIAGRQGDDPLKMMERVGALMSTSFESSLARQDEVLRLHRNAYEVEGEKEDEQMDDKSLVQYVVEIIVEKIHELIKMNPLKAKLAKRELFGMEEFKRVTSDPTLFGQTIADTETELEKANPGTGRAVVDTLLKKFGLVRPE